MKKLVLAGLVVLSALACKKDKGDDNNNNNQTPGETYEARLEGQWELKEVDYDGTYQASQFPLPQNFQGSGSNVSGDFVLSRNPNNITYSYSFIATITTLAGDFDVPIQRSGTGTWSVSEDGSTITVDDPTQDNDLILSVVTNEKNVQKYNTDMVENVTVSSFQIDVETNVDLLFNRK